MCVLFVPDGAKDGFGETLEKGWYFYGEDDGATMYGPYETKEIAESALIKYGKDLDRNELEYINYLKDQDNVDG